jgi:hypothetical protein
MLRNAVVPAAAVDHVVLIAECEGIEREIAEAESRSTATDRS